MQEIEKALCEIVLSQQVSDAAHDIEHIKRVVSTAKQLAKTEKADLNIVIPAAWLHDIVAVAKDDPRRSIASKLAAQKAVELLTDMNYPQQYLKGIYHAIEAHSFSANITPTTLEAQVVQDADRLDALGAIGLARCFMVNGQLMRPLYHLNDPFCKDREPNDQQFCIDHFFVKLFKVPGTMSTQAGKQEGAKRVAFMESFLHQLGLEIH